MERDQDQGDQGYQKQLRGVQVGSQLVTPMSRGPFERNGLRKTETDGDRLVARPVLDGDTGPGSGYIGWELGAIIHRSIFYLPISTTATKVF